MKYEWEKDINANALIEKADDALIGFGEDTLQSRYRGECNVTVLAVAVVNHDSGEAALIFPDGYEVTDVCALDLVQDILRVRAESAAKAAPHPRKAERAKS